jgi:hypothetical protein
MRRLAIAVLLFAFAPASAVAQTGHLQPSSQSSVQAANTPGAATIVVPSGTMVSLALTHAILAKRAKVGDDVYAETAFPVAVNGQMAIPPSTYVRGQIDTLARPGIFSPHAQFQIHFTKLIFANGYAVNIPSLPSATAGTSLTPPDDVIPAVANPYVDVSARSDVLLDNGAQIDMVLQLPLLLDATSVEGAVRASKPVKPGQFKSATMCRTIPGTPGTPDTVIPGSAGSPGTPDTVIPGVNGAPDTVIPGIPATPGTPDTVIPGSPSTPDILCPGPPVVAASTKAMKESFQVSVPFQVSGNSLPAGSYQITWKGSGPLASVQIVQNKKVVASMQARIVLLDKQSPSVIPGMLTNPDGSVYLRSLRFAGQSFALYFDQAASGGTL